MANQVLDPWDDRDDVAGGGGTNTIWGLVTMNRWLCVLEKGVGKVPYDPGIHGERKPTKAVDVFIQPLPEMPAINDKQLERRMVNFEDQWVRIMHPSIKACGVNDLKVFSAGVWAKIEIVKTGETYTTKEGQTKDKTTYKFVATFPDEAACRVDYTAAQGGQPQTTVTTPAPAQPAVTSDAERAKMVPFMRTVVQNAFKQVGPDLGAIGLQLAKFPMVAKYFTAESSEVQAYVMELATPKAA